MSDLPDDGKHRNNLGVLVPHWVMDLDISDAALRFYIGIADLVGGMPIVGVSDDDGTLVVELLNSGAVRHVKGVLVGPWMKP